MCYYENVHPHKIRNSAGCGKETLAPEILDGPVGSILLAGDELELFCTVRGNPPPTARIMKLSAFENSLEVEDYTEMISAEVRCYLHCCTCVFDQL